MNAVITIAAHELRRLFKSPLAWIMLAIVELLLAILFFIMLSQFLNPAPWSAGRGVTEIVAAGLLQIAGIILLLVTPFMTMRIFSEERRTGTIRLLFSAPISITELVLGKYLGMLGFLVVMLLMIALMPLSLLLGSPLDLMQIGAGLLGLMLLMASFAAIGLFISSLTSQPAIAAISTFGILFMLWISNLAANNGSEMFKAIFSYISLLNHYDNLIDGMFNSADVIYYCIIIATFVILCIWRLDTERMPSR